METVFDATQASVERSENEMAVTQGKPESLQLLERVVQCLIENVYDHLHDTILDTRKWTRTQTIALENAQIALACPEWKIQGHHDDCRTQKLDSSVRKVNDIVKFLEGCSEPMGTADLTPELIRCIATEKWQDLHYVLSEGRWLCAIPSTPILEALDKVVENHQEEFLPSKFTKD
jgi:hypothetical protein